MKKLFLYSIFSILLLIPSIGYSTHLMGGNLAYEYLGETFLGSGMFRYKIIFKTYTNCDSSANEVFQKGPEGFATIGIYYDDPKVLTSSGTTNKLLFQNLSMTIVDTTRITPDNPSGCNVGKGLCIDEGIYVDTVTLPVEINGEFVSGGFHVYYERCCRNGDILNLSSPGDQGMGFYAYIPPPITQNNSPVFTDLPLPFICSNDTVGILNTAYDADGDFLLFSFENPYEGEYTENGLNGNLLPYLFSYPDSLNWLLPTVNWQFGGFDKNNPFGASGSAEINGFTGHSKYFVPTLGKYVVAVEIKEYRNNNLIGITRRDMQLLVLNCPSNNAPKLISATGTSFSIEEGDSLCFPVAFNDADNNTVVLKASGSVIDPALTIPTGTINVPVSGSPNASSQFCWNTACGQDKGVPYLLNVTATDDGCPNKTTPIVYSIKVNPYKGPETITGPTNLCKNATGVQYSASAITNATYDWEITGGTQVTGTNTNTITVDWGNNDYGKVSVVSTSGFGCISDPLSIDVSLDLALTLDVGFDDSICSGKSVVLGGSPTTASSAVYSWTPTLGLLNPDSANPIASPLITTTYTLVATVSGNCTNTDSVTITIASSPEVNSGITDTICAGDTIQITASGATSYSWSSSQTLSNASISSPLAFPKATTTYTVTGVNQVGCSDTATALITVNPIPTINLTNQIDTCKNALVELGANQPVLSGATYLWTPSKGLSNSFGSNPTLTATEQAKYILQVTDSNNCSTMDSVTVTIFEVITDSKDTSFCTDQPVQLSVSVVSGLLPVSYTWTPTTGLSDSTIANPVVSIGNSGTYKIITTDSKNCSDTISIKLDINQKTSADFEEVYTPTCDGVFIAFNNKSQDYTNLVWDLGEFISNEEGPTLKLPFNTQETVSLTTTSSGGCLETISKTISAKSFEFYFDLEAPNVFTPNGDGINEWFELKNMQYLSSCADVHIYNRWGELIFISTDTNHSWDGRTFAGEEVPAGHYFYVINVKDQIFKGSVTLLR